ncbi:hypothetical protein KUCAC02_029430 [Chaenocephalus aceratus]|nr:hypothetical protein KUCAC02_029430 [Chaenocephalus aceratus]
MLPNSLGYFGNTESEWRYEVCGDDVSTPSSSGPPAPQPAQPNLFRFGGRPVASAGRAGPAAAVRTYSRGIDSDTVEELVLAAAEELVLAAEELVLAAEELVLAAEELVLAAEELVLAAAEELPAITQALRDLSQYAQANKASTVALTTDQVSTVKSTFK